MEICKPLQCKASEAKISELKPPDKKKDTPWVCLSFWDFSTFDRAAPNILGAPCLRPVRDPKIRVRCFDEGGTEAD